MTFDKPSKGLGTDKRLENAERLITGLSQRLGVSTASLNSLLDVLARAGLASKETKISPVVMPFGTSAGQVTSGNDPRLDDARAPTGAASGDLTGTYPAPTVANDAITYAKMQNISATDKLLGRSTSGAGNVEEIACTAAGRAILDDADAAAQRTTLGLGTAATQATSAFDAAGAAASAQSAAQAYALALTPTILVFGLAGAVPSAVTRYLYPGANVGAIAEIKLRLLVGGTVQKLAVRAATAPGVGLTDVYTVRKGGSDTALTASLADANVEAEDTTHTVAFASGDDLSIKVVTGLLSAASDVMVSLVMV